MSVRSKINIHLASVEEADNLYRILKPEVKSDRRAQTKLSLDKANLIIELQAMDTTVARAALNSYARWIRLYEEIGGIN